MKLGLAVFVAALLVLSQVALPPLAENALKDELSRTGTVESVEVSAFPALKLLFEEADSVRVRMSRARVGSGDIADQLAGTSRASSLDASVAVLELGPLVVRDVTLRKDGDSLVGTASLTAADLASALPVDLGLEPVSSDDGALVLRATVGPVTADARLSASDGGLLIAPDGLLGGFASLTVFRDERVRITSVGATGDADAFTVVTKARLTG